MLQLCNVISTPPKSHFNLFCWHHSLETFEFISKNYSLLIVTFLHLVLIFSFDFSFMDDVHIHNYHTCRLSYDSLIIYQKIRLKNTNFCLSPYHHLLPDYTIVLPDYTVVHNLPFKTYVLSGNSLWVKKSS